MNINGTPFDQCSTEEVKAAWAALGEAIGDEMLAQFLALDRELRKRHIESVSLPPPWRKAVPAGLQPPAPRPDAGGRK